MANKSIDLRRINADLASSRTGMEQRLEGFDQFTGLFSVAELPADMQLALKTVVLGESHFRVQKDLRFYLFSFGITPRRLNKVLEFHLGKSLYALLQERLFREAGGLLLGTTLSVKEISYRLSFSEPAYFCRWFKKWTGMTPKTWRSISRSLISPTEAEFNGRTKPKTMNNTEETIIKSR